MYRVEQISVEGPRSTFARHSWIIRTDGGYECKVCIEGKFTDPRAQGTWIQKPFRDPKSLCTAADKHANSVAHKVNEARVAAMKNETNVLQQIIQEVYLKKQIFQYSKKYI